MKKLITALFICSSLLSIGQGRDIQYNAKGKSFTGFAAVPANPLAGEPGVLIIHAWMGITGHEKRSAEKLAEAGYYVFVADIYGNGNKPAGKEQAASKSGEYKKNRTLYRERIVEGLEQLKKLGAAPESLAVMGYCFGGTGALEAARANMPVKGVISFHGGLDKGSLETAHLVKPSVLVLHGADDPYVPQKDIEAFKAEMDSARADWQMVYYADAVHSFTEPTAGNNKSAGAAYNAKAAQRSWDHLMVFLEELFSL